MTTQELVKKVADTTGVNHEVVKAVVDEAFDQIRLSVEEGEPFYKRGFGTFSIKLRKGGICNLNRKAEKMPDKKKPFFKPCKEFVENCNE